MCAQHAKSLCFVRKEDITSKKTNGVVSGGVLALAEKEVAMGNPFVHVELMSTDVSCLGCGNRKVSNWGCGRLSNIPAARSLISFEQELLRRFFVLRTTRLRLPAYGS